MAGPLRTIAAPAQGLLELANCGLVCIEHGGEFSRRAARRVGIRTSPSQSRATRFSFSQQMRVRRTLGSRAYDEGTKELRVEVSNEGDAARAARVAGHPGRGGRRGQCLIY